MVYLLHFDRPVSDRHTTQHYLGYTSRQQWSKRIAEHRSGNGAKLTAAAKRKGIGFSVAAVWEGGRELERKLKRQHNSPRLCPICQAKREGQNDS